MKKIITLSSLVLLISGCSFLNNSTLNLNDKLFLEDDTTSESTEENLTTYIPVDGDGNFTLEGSDSVTDIKTFIKGRNDTFWTTRSYCALDSFFDSINNNGEDWTGTFKSKTFVQKNEYIYFTLGGSATNEVVLVDENDSNKNKTITNTYFSDPNASCNMLIYSIKIDSSSIGHNMHVEVIDKTTSDFGGITFGDLHVNQTEEEVAKAYSIYLNLSYLKI